MQNHQEALLVILSYIIGFITAFIMFGLADNGSYKEVHLNQLPDDSLIDDERTAGGGFPTVMPSLREDEEGLFVQYASESDEIIAAKTSEAIAKPGFYVAIIASKLSPSTDYANYCAQMDADSEACHHFIYSLEDHKTYLVKHEDGTPLVTGNDEADSLNWTSDFEVSMNGKTASAESNWVLR